jgi:hypothetical protein
MFGSNVILVGHSNGGIVARMRGGDQALAGVLTWASPNAGVPLVNNFPWLVGYAGVTVSDATNVIIALSAYYLGADALNALDDPIDWVIQNVFNAVGGVADYLGYWYAPVLNDMAAGSSFQGVLNSGSHISEEQSNVGTIVSASFTPDYWYYGGMMTLLSYSNAIVTTDFVYGLAAGCYQWAFDLDNNADPNMDDDQWFALLDAEDALNWLGDDLAGFDAAWCSAVTGYNVTGPGDCPANDEVVPQWSSDLSWTVARHFPGTGNVHNRVAGDYLDLQNVLQNNFGVP